MLPSVMYCKYREVIFVRSKRLAFFLSILLTGLLMAAPVSAASPDFLLNLNGEYYQEPLKVQNGVSIVSLEFVEKVVPVTIVADSDKIVLTMNEDTLEMRLGSALATFNGLELTMPAFVKMDNRGVMVPLRFVLECFGAKVDWNGVKSEISVTSPVLKDGFTAGQMLSRITQVMSEQGSYKMKADTIAKTEMKNEGKSEKVIVSGQVNGFVQEKPLLGYVVSEVKLEEISGSEDTIPAEAIKTEVVVNSNGIYMTLPEYEGWVKVELPGTDYDKLLEQYGTQEPVKSLMQMKQFGAVITYGDDLLKDGKNYGVIHVAMGEQALGQYMESVLQQIGSLGLVNEPSQDTAELDALMKNILDKMKTAIDYNMVFDYDTLLTTAMDMSMTMEMDIDVPADAENGTPATSMQIKSVQTADYQIYDYGVKFTTPDVSGAKPMTEALESITNN